MRKGNDRFARIRAVVGTMALALVGGCFTMHETEYPAVELSTVGQEKEVTVRVQGFEASLTEYVPVYGYETVYVAGHHGFRRRGFVPGHYATVSTQTYLPQTRQNDTFFQRAEEMFEQSGCNVKAAQPDYLVEVHFAGPIHTDGDSTAEALWFLLSVLSVNYDVDVWTAKLKIHDNRTGRLVFAQEYSQRYNVAVWSPIPLFGPLSSSKNTYNAIQSWCLTALTDRAVADATAFLAKAK